MSVPDEYYIIMPSGAFSDIQRFLKGKTGNDIPESTRQQIDEYLVDNGEWTDKNQLMRKGHRDFRYWTIGGSDRVIVERE
jgi:hypothetical protein